MSYRKIPMSRNKLIAAYWKNGVRQPLRKVAAELVVAHNTVRNWLIKLDLYDSECLGRQKIQLNQRDIHQR